MEENKIFVIYVGILGIRSEDIDTYVKKITSRITPESVEGEFITIPTNTYETKIDCINPKYVTEGNLIKEHSKLMKDLNKELQYQLKELRENYERK